MKTLSRDDILAAGAREVVPVEVPDWDGIVYLRPLSAAEVTRVYASKKDDYDVTQAIVALSICDESGAHLFTADDAPALFDKGFAGLQTLTSKALEINRMGKAAVDTARKA